MGETEDSLSADVAAVGQIDAVPRILEVICRTTGMGFAAVARVTDRRWVACAVRDEIAFGLKPGGELRVETTICDEIRDSGKGVIIDEVAADAAYCGHPTPAMYGFQSYISIPIRRADQSFFGTLCAIDPRPAKVSRPEVVAMFELFAELIAVQLEAQERLSASEAALKEQRAAADVRERFIAALGHDLRNPLAAIDAGVKRLRKTDEKNAPLIHDMIDKTVARMAEIIDNVLDLARGRLGGGIAVTLVEQPALGAYLEQVVEELRTTAPERQIETVFAMPDAVVCDRWRIARLLSNLLGNAITYGAPYKPIRVRGETRDGAFELSIVNAGEAIPPETMTRIFQPFVRGDSERREGLGLGLYIASEIARAHNGALTVASNAEETRFSFRMPLRPPG